MYVSVSVYKCLYVYIVVYEYDAGRMALRLGYFCLAAPGWGMYLSKSSVFFLLLLLVFQTFSRNFLFGFIQKAQVLVKHEIEVEPASKPFCFFFFVLLLLFQKDISY